MNFILDDVKKLKVETALKSKPENIEEAIAKGIILSSGKTALESIKGEVRDVLHRVMMEMLATKPSKEQTEVLYKYFRKVTGE